MDDKENLASANPEESDVLERPTLPFALQKRVMRQYIGAAMVAALTIMCLVFLQSAGYAIGFAFTAYLIWMGLDISNRWRTGKIVCRRVICLKVQRIPLLKNKQVVVLKEIDAEPGAEAAVRSFYVPASGKDAVQFSEHMILNVYVEARNATELIAWQAIDLAQ